MNYRQMKVTSDKQAHVVAYSTVLPTSLSHDWRNDYPIIIVRLLGFHGIIILFSLNTRGIEYLWDQRWIQNPWSKKDAKQDDQFLPCHAAICYASLATQNPGQNLYKPVSNST